MNHFALDYAKHVNKVLHDVLWSTWFYKLEVVEVPGLVTALLITYDNQKDDEFVIRNDMTWDQFLERMSRVKSDWAYFSIDIMKGFAEKPQKVMLGWEGRTIYFIKGGSNPEYWTFSNAYTDTILLLEGSIQMQGPMIQLEVLNVKESIPVGHQYSHEYENYIRVVINFLFLNHLSEAKLQPRTEPGNSGLEIRDLICQNRAEIGFWKDLKDKYSCSEIVIEVKNTVELTRDNLRQIYCYLKPSLGFWGFIVCREEQTEKIHAYNRTLYNNFSHQRGILILSDGDLKKMVEIKTNSRDPSDYLRDRMSDFCRSI